MTDNTSQGQVCRNPLGSVQLEVSIILTDGRKLSARVCEKLWWDVIQDTSMADLEKEKAIVELLTSSEDDEELTLQERLSL